MPTFGEVLSVLTNRSETNPKPPSTDQVRRDALKRLATLTGRPTVLYASRWVQGDARSEIASVNIEDVHAFMEVLHGLKGPKLDLIIHSSGGSPTAAEALVNYIRTKFDDVRVIVPLAAMSAATLIACSANSIVLGKHSYLGPIDPQLLLQTPLGVQLVPAQLIEQQFRRAQGEANNPAAFPAYIPMLSQYGPALLAVAEQVRKLSDDLCTAWLAKWMLRDQPNPTETAKTIAAKLNEHIEHRVHGRFLSREYLKNLGLVIEDLEDSQEFQDAVLTVFHATSLTFALANGCQKIVENHAGRAFIRFATATLKTPPASPPPKPPAPPAAPPREAPIPKTFEKQLLRYLKKLLAERLLADD